MITEYFHSSTSGALLRRTTDVTGLTDEALVNGVWVPTNTIVDYMFGEDSNVDPVSEEEANQRIAAANASRADDTSEQPLE